MLAAPALDGLGEGLQAGGGVLLGEFSDKDEVVDIRPLAVDFDFEQGIEDVFGEIGREGDIEDVAGELLELFEGQDGFAAAGGPDEDERGVEGKRAGLSIIERQQPIEDVEMPGLRIDVDEGGGGVDVVADDLVKGEDGSSPWRA